MPTVQRVPGKRSSGACSKPVYSSRVHGLSTQNGRVDCERTTRQHWQAAFYSFAANGRKVPLTAFGTIYAGNYNKWLVSGWTSSGRNIFEEPTSLSRPLALL